MKMNRLVLLLALVGCVPDTNTSKSPICSESNARELPGIEGEWSRSDVSHSPWFPKESVVVSRLGGRAEYLVERKSIAPVGGEPIFEKIFTIHTCRIGGKNFVSGLTRTDDFTHATIELSYDLTALRADFFFWDLDALKFDNVIFIETYDTNRGVRFPERAIRIVTPLKPREIIKYARKDISQKFEFQRLK